MNRASDSTYAFVTSTPLVEHQQHQSYKNRNRRSPPIYCHTHPIHGTRSSSVDASKPSRRNFLRILPLLSVIPYLQARPSLAMCGEPDPFFAHYLDWREDVTGVSSGREVHYRLVGNVRKERNSKRYPVIFLGDAGVSLAIWETMELLGGSDRRLLFVDLLGVGDSDKVSPAILGDDKERLELAVEETLAVLKATDIGRNPPKGLKKQPMHVVAAGFGLRVAEGVIRRLRDVEFVSLTAEAWGKDAAAEVRQLVGEKICAVEALERGDKSLLTAVVKESDDVVRRMSKILPTLALRTTEQKGLKGDANNVKQVVVDGGGRLAHLSSSQQTSDAIDTFLSEIEQKINEEL